MCVCLCITLLFFLRKGWRGKYFPSRCDVDVHVEEDASETNFIEKSKLSAGARILRGP